MHRIAGFALLSFAVLVGCAGSDRPQGADESSEAETTVSQSLADDTPDADAAPAPAVCDPIATRACTERWIDGQGTAHCLGSTQFCRADGKAWLPCGVRQAVDSDAGL